MLGTTQDLTVAANIVVKFTVCSNRFYELQFNDDLTTANRTTLITNIPGTGGIVSVTDSGAVELANRFYRVKLLL
jgi:hypothetical protein